MKHKYLKVIPKHIIRLRYVLKLIKSEILIHEYEFIGIYQVLSG